MRQRVGLNSPIEPLLALSSAPLPHFPLALVQLAAE